MYDSTLRRCTLQPSLALPYSQNSSEIISPNMCPQGQEDLICITQNYRSQRSGSKEYRTKCVQSRIQREKHWRTTRTLRNYGITVQRDNAWWKPKNSDRRGVTNKGMTNFICEEEVHEAIRGMKCGRAIEVDGSSLLYTYQRTTDRSGETRWWRPSWRAPTAPRGAKGPRQGKASTEDIFHRNGEEGYLFQLGKWDTQNVNITEELHYYIYRTPLSSGDEWCTPCWENTPVLYAGNPIRVHV